MTARCGWKLEAGGRKLEAGQLLLLQY